MIVKPRFQDNGTAEADFTSINENENIHILFNKKIGQLLSYFLVLLLWTIKES